MFNQLTTFIIYIISGMAICLFYDVFRVLRKSIKTSNTVTYIEDAIFWLVVGTFLIWEILKISYGELRSYIFVGLLLGSIIYFFTISKYFIKVNVKIFTFVKDIVIKFFSPIIKLILKPICFVCINLKLKIYKAKKNNNKKRRIL